MPSKSKYKVQRKILGSKSKVLRTMMSPPQLKIRGYMLHYAETREGWKYDKNYWSGLLWTKPPDVAILPVEDPWQ
jgi:hypothetical protein